MTVELVAAIAGTWTLGSTLTAALWARAHRGRRARQDDYRLAS